METSSQELAGLVIETDDLLHWLVGGILSETEGKLTSCRNINPRRY